MNKISTKFAKVWQLINKRLFKSRHNTMYYMYMYDRGMSLGVKAPGESKAEHPCREKGGGGRGGGMRH